MHEQLEEAAGTLGGTLVDDLFLLEECTHLVEEPHVVPGGFDASFLDLPDSVIVSVMRDHQRYFAVRGQDERLLPRYLNVVNTALDPETIARGNDRVLRARLADARFFVDEDRKMPLADRVPRLDGVVFQNKLGSVGDKVRRMAELAAGLLEGDEAVSARRAATLAKADLVTLIVGEFPELQGEMGCFYALEEGVEPTVAHAIRDHYRPRGASDALPQEPIGAAVAIADRIDTLVGCFGIGLIPSGSADPFALRRAALGVVRIGLEGPMDVDLRSLVGKAHGLFEVETLAPLEQVQDKLFTFFRARLKAVYAERFPTDLVEACLGAWDGASLRDFDARVEAVAAFKQLPAYESLAIAFKRAFNIAKDAPEGAPDPALFREDAERALADCFSSLAPRLDAWVGEGDYDAALKQVAHELREPVDRFFEEVLVMADDPAVRDNRLRLLGGIAGALTRIAHFHHLST
jgi:glycyl-tRNA synthetase beta chain